MGILTQYSELLAGNATERVEVVGLDAADAFDKFLARAAPIDINAEASVTGFATQTPAPKEGEPAGPPIALEASPAPASPLHQATAQGEPIPIKREVD